MSDTESSRARPLYIPSDAEHWDMTVDYQGRQVGMWVEHGGVLIWDLDAPGDPYEWTPKCALKDDDAKSLWERSQRETDK